jgi:acetyltransferase
MRIRLDDGTPVRLRPARPADSAAVQAMHRRLSRTSLFFRYLRLYTPTLADIEAICRLGGKEGLALVAITDGRNPSVAGLAYLIVGKDRLTATAEPAIVIEDRFHGRGLGRQLFAQLCRMARKRDIAVLHTYVHKDNQKMQRILKHLEYPLVEKCHSDMVEAEIILNPGADFGWLPPELAGFGGHAMTECSM